MTYAIILIIFGVFVYVHASWRGGKAADEKNLAGVLWHGPWLAVGALAIYRGFNLLGIW